MDGCCWHLSSTFTAFVGSFLITKSQVGHELSLFDLCMYGIGLPPIAFVFLVFLSPGICARRACSFRAFSGGHSSTTRSRIRASLSTAWVSLLKGDSLTSECAWCVSECVCVYCGLGFRAWVSLLKGDRLASECAWL